MFKKLVTSMLFSALLCPFLYTPVIASTDAEKRVRFAERARLGIMKLGTGRDARVSVKLRDKTKLAGYVSRAEEDLFVVTDLATGQATPVAYVDVAQVKGNNLSTGAKIAIGIGIGVGLTLLIIYLLYMSLD